MPRSSWWRTSSVACPNRRRNASSDPPVHRTRAVAELRGKFAVIANAATEVNRSIFFSAAIIIAGFVPLFTMSGIEGHIFGPMAKTYAYAIGGGLIATFTVTPALCGVLLRDQENEKDTLFVRLLHRSYEPVAALRAGQPHPDPGRSGDAAAGVPGWRCGRWGWSSCPSWKKAIMWIRATMPTSISLEDGNAYVNRMRAILRVLSGGHHGGVAARPARRRHRRDRVLQRRVLRSVEAVRQLARRGRQGAADRPR